MNHIGFISRDNIPISYAYWKPPEAKAVEEDEDQDEEHDGPPPMREDVVPDTEKDMIVD